MFISKDIKYIGVNDRDIDLFEGQYVVPNAENNVTVLSALNNESREKTAALAKELCE